MPVVNFRLDRISGERKKVEGKNVEVTSNFMITSVKKEKSENFGEYLLVKFKFDVAYKPDLGNLKLEGNLWYREPDLKKVIVKEEGKKIELNGESVKDISTAIIRDSLLESVELAKKLRLPVPLRLPKVNVKPKQVKFPKAS